MSRIKGISVKRGARETFIPCILPLFTVSEITRAINGPGDKPAVIPKKRPVRRKSTTISLQKLCMYADATFRLRGFKLYLVIPATSRNPEKRKRWIPGQARNDAIHIVSNDIRYIVGHSVTSIVYGRHRYEQIQDISLHPRQKRILQHLKAHCCLHP